VDSPECTISVPLAELGQKLSALRLSHPASDEPLRRSLGQHGQLSALSAFGDRGQLQLVDGFKRLRGARLLGWTHVRVRVLEQDAATATAAIVALHAHRGLSDLEQGWIIRCLCREHGLSQGAVAQLMSRHKSWVSRRLLLVEALDEAVQAEVRLGLLSARSALSVAALPRGNQRQAADLVTGRGMTTRQAEALVRQLLGLDSDEARAHAIARWPQVCPEPPSGSRRARPRSDSEQLLSDVARLTRLAVRIEVHLVGNPLGIDGPDVVRDALGNLAPLLATLATAVGRALSPTDQAHATLSQP